MTTQPLDALVIANERRMAAAAWRRRVAVLPMEEGLDAMVEELKHPFEASSMPLVRFLNTATSMGNYKAQIILKDARINPMRWHHRLVDLTDRERRALAYALEAEVWKRS